MTRKEWRGLTSFGVILLIFCASSVIGIGAAAASPSASINPIATSGLNQSDVFQVTVEVDSDTNDLSSLEINLFYDSSALQVNSITEDGLLGGSILIAPGSGDDGAGTITYGIASTAGTYSPESGTFITIVFQVKAAAAAGTYNLNLDDVEFLDDVDDVITGVVVTDGTATVVGTPSTSNPTVKVDPIATSGLNQGDVFQVTVEVDSDTNDLSSLDMNLFYDSSALQVNSITEDGLLGGSILIAPGSGDDGAGTISYGIASTAGTYSPESGTFITIVFQIKDTAAVGTYNLNLDNVELLDDVDDVITGVVVTDGEVTVGSAASAVRTLPTSVERGEQFTVSMDLSDYGTNGSVVETIPESFTYVNSTLDASNVTVVNNTITFMLWGETNFEYDVTASNTEGPYAFSGMLTDESANDVVVSGDTSIDVVLPDGVILLPGWNFISVPKELADPNVSSVLTGVASDAVVYYNADTRVWEATVSTFEPFKGYWINVSATEQVILEDSLAAKQDDDKWIPPLVQLYKGWNAVGSNYESAESAEMVLFTVDDSYSKIVDKYGVVGLNGKYEEEAYGTEHFMMNPYEGYWVFVTQNDELA